jgi:hypothetical protein
VNIDRNYEGHIASILVVEEWTKQETSKKQVASSFL